MIGFFVNEHFLNNLILGLIVFYLIALIIQLKIEYFPSKMRYSEDIYNKYTHLKLYRKYRNNTLINNLPEIKRNLWENS